VLRVLLKKKINSLYQSYSIIIGHYNNIVYYYYSSHSTIQNSGDRAKNSICRGFRFTECSNNKGKRNYRVTTSLCYSTGVDVLTIIDVLLINNNT